VDVTRAAVETAKLIIAQINPQMPRVHGDGFIHIKQIHHWIEVNEPILEAPQASPSTEEMAIGKFVAE
jgi:hypothetical protein